MDLRQIRLAVVGAHSKQWDYRFSDLKLDRLFQEKRPLVVKRARVSKLKWFDSPKKGPVARPLSHATNPYGVLRSLEGKEDVFNRFPVLKQKTESGKTLFHDVIQGCRYILRDHARVPLRKKKALEDRIEKAKRLQPYIAEAFPGFIDNKLVVTGVTSYPAKYKCDACPCYLPWPYGWEYHRPRSIMSLGVIDCSSPLTFHLSTRRHSRQVFACGSFVPELSVDTKVETFTRRLRHSKTDVLVDCLVRLVRYHYLQEGLVAPLPGIRLEVNPFGFGVDELPRLRKLRQTILSPAVHGRANAKARAAAIRLAVRYMLAFTYTGHLIRTLIRYKLGNARYGLLKRCVRIIKLRKLKRNRKFSNLQHHARLVSQSLSRISRKPGKRRLIRKLKKVKVKRIRYERIFNALKHSDDQTARLKYGWLENVQCTQKRRVVKRHLKPRKLIRRRSLKTTPVPVKGRIPFRSRGLG